MPLEFMPKDRESFYKRQKMAYRKCNFVNKMKIINSDNPTSQKK
jgi:hypothetical protein